MVARDEQLHGFGMMSEKGQKLAIYSIYPFWLPETSIFRRFIPNQVTNSWSMKLSSATESTRAEFGKVDGPRHRVARRKVLDEVLKDSLQLGAPVTQCLKNIPFSHKSAILILI